MTALAADTAKQYTIGDSQAFPVKASADVIYQGAIVMVLTSTGYAEKGADTADCKFVGVALEQVDNSSGSAGDKSVTVRMSGTYDFACASATQAWVGVDVYIADDATVALVGTTTNDVKVGRVVEFISATKIRVLLNPHG